ncbi:MAG: 4-alpha-glucanotransferase [Phycisphaerales bacterium]|jgi:4-alpha-glucanotransferase|nr:4-alpha-glucanotransferase [Phycisphaerales bacterium]
MKSTTSRNNAFVLAGRRASGLLMHPTSLPGAHGNGDAGPAAYRFVDFLHAAGQRWWQMLPIVPPGAKPGYSPYSSTSAFAGSPFLISLEMLANEGLLERSDLNAPAAVTRGEPDATQRFRLMKLRAAHERFANQKKLHAEFDAFRARERAWLDDFALFSAIKQTEHDRSWTQWHTPLRLRHRDAMQSARRGLADEIRFHQFVQFLFDRQWTALRKYAHDRGVGMIGDIPIFVALDSADVWANPKLFLLDRAGRPKVVTGCPPDAFCCDGQLWGHPHYHWPAHARTNFQWWVRRFQSVLHHFDAARIDHFLGFYQAWHVPARAKTAKSGRYVAGPRDAIFRAVRSSLGNVSIIAEDLGNVVPGALALRDRWRFPGMRVMQFGFGPGGEHHLPHTYTSRAVAYTGTHDNDTTVGWFKNLAARNGQARAEHEKVVNYLDFRGPRDIHWAMIKSAMLSVADTVIFPVQDILGLGNEARMNVPGIAENNWRWRMSDRALTPALAATLKGLTELSDREGE